MRPQLALATRAWSAYRSPDPRAIEELLRGDTSALPFLAAALARHLEEFPSDADGLSRSERRLMEQAIEGPADLRAAFPRMHHGETAYYIADSWFVDRARELAGASPALVDLSITGDTSSAIPSGTLALTRAGRKVLDGAADRVAALRHRSLAWRRACSRSRPGMALERALGPSHRSVTALRSKHE